MFPIRSLFFALSTCVLLTSCGGDDPDEPAPAVIPINLTSTSIADGSTVSADLKEVTFIFSTSVTATATDICKLNGNTNPYTVNINKVTATLSLEPGKAYSVTFAEGAFTNPTGAKSAAIQLSFATEAEVVPPVVSIAANLTNSNATESARKVYKLLYDNYGKKILSGVMGEVAWGSSFYDEVAKSAGKQPAIIGFDYIHIPYSPANWIDYGDITPVKSAWDAGSIPAICWHWNVPDGKGGYGTGKDMPFDPAKILVSGTEENKIALADVAEMAESLKKLQDAGIAVLFRPFHEAAGDYTWGAWFWWGKDGAETTKALWKWLYNTLTNDYKLNNLVWVWTMQTSDEGKLAAVSKLRAAYPGDECVDIVGADLYEPSYSDQSAKFNLLTSAVEGHKMVALAETGNLMSPDKDLANGALWSYFMGWYEWDNNRPALGKEWNKNGEWKTVLNNPLVLNRGDFKL